VIQKHAATRLHYDFRLEMGGALKSWAVPKGPSLDPAEKRLAVEVEDHPIEYGKFEGTIPRGQYGGGSVLLWDRGSWKPEGDPLKAYRAGKIKFALAGEKLHGGWTLVRMRPRPGEDTDKPNWLLIKEKDAEARSMREVDVLEDRPESVETGRELEEIGAKDKTWQSNRHTPRTAKPARIVKAAEAARAGKAAKAAKAAKTTKATPKTAKKSAASRARAPRLDPAGVDGAKKGALPRTIAPQLATLVDRPPEGDDWLFEVKLDGYRILARLDAGKVTLVSRNGKDWTARFPDVAAAIAALPAKQAVLDGEIVVVLPNGTTSFQALQNALSHGRGANVVYYAFDLLHLDGYDLTKAAIEDRKALLEPLLAEADASLRYGEHVVGRGVSFHRAACQHALEGVIAKRAGAAYRSGRSAEWLKIKCMDRQEMVIGGYTDPAGSRKGLGALLLGVHDQKGGTLRFAGKVGTGFDDATLRALAQRLGKLETKASPFSDLTRAPRGVHWVKPALVGEVEFIGWTNDGKLRHPSFQGLREDRDPKTVIRERAAKVEVVEDEPALEEAPAKRGRGAPRAARAPRTTAGATKLTHPDKVLDATSGTTKRDLADYVRAVAPRMLPLVAGRPLMLLRCPDGVGKACFHQKNAPDPVPPGLAPVTIPSAKGGVEGTYMTVENAEGLVSLVQLGSLEIHVWGSKAEDLERPERLVFDLDPGPGVPWADVVRGAKTMRALLEELGLASFPLVTGGKGFHVVVPVEPGPEWPEAKAFCRAVVQAAIRREPGRYTAQLSKDRRVKKIFIDYLRNGRGATAIAPYSMRARPGMPIAVPIAWSEVTARLAPDRYHAKDVVKRIAAADPWAGYEKNRASLAQVLQAARGAMSRR
jgi:bifunctional non-homologous end joining protein LigD